MVKYKIWDKKECIEGVSADEILKDIPILQKSDVFLVIESGRTTHILSADVERAILGMDENSTVEEVAERYVYNKNSNQMQLPENVLKLQKLENKISILEEGLANTEYSLMMGGLM